MSQRECLRRAGQTGGTEGQRLGADRAVLRQTGEGGQTVDGIHGCGAGEGCSGEGNGHRVSGIGHGVARNVLNRYDRLGGERSSVHETGRLSRDGELASRTVSNDHRGDSGDCARVGDARGQVASTDNAGQLDTLAGKVGDTGNRSHRGSAADGRIR